MKKNILILFFIMLSGTYAQAQLKLGVKGGANFSYTDVEYADIWFDQPSISGFNIGIMGKFTLPIVGFGVQAEALFTQKGGIIRQESGDVRCRFNYIDIPIYFRWGYDLIVVRPYVGIGPYFSFGVHKSVSGNTEWIDLNPDQDLINGDFGFGGTLGVEILNKLQVSLCYQLGVRNLYDGPLDFDIKNRNFSISLGYYVF